MPILKHGESVAVTIDSGKLKGVMSALDDMFERRAGHAGAAPG